MRKLRLAQTSAERPASSFPAGPGRALALALAALLPGAAAEIDGGGWTPEGAGFTLAADGAIRYSGSGPERARLVSRDRFTSGVFTLRFSGYRCDNAAPPARGLGSVAALGLGLAAENHWVRIERGQIRGRGKGAGSGGYIEVNWVVPEDPERIHVNYVESTLASGFLRIRYDGTRVTFFFRASAPDPWTPMQVLSEPGAGAQAGSAGIPMRWPAAGVPLFLQACPGGTRGDRYTLSFAADPVEVAPCAPE